MNEAFAHDLIDLLKDKLEDIAVSATPDPLIGDTLLRIATALEGIETALGELLEVRRDDTYSSYSMAMDEEMIKNAKEWAGETARRRALRAERAKKTEERQEIKGKG